jgi:uncharacterized protein (DUF1684 family)
MHRDDDPHPELTGPDAPPAAVADSRPRYPGRILAERLAKDELFRHSARSPLPPDRRPSFNGLRYFSPDERYRITGLRLEAVAEGDAAPFLMDTSDHRPRSAHRIGRVRFHLDGRPLALTAYRVGTGTANSLFLPFRDLTTGNETYGVGRYLDVEPEADGSYVLDFNLAYNPLCAYSETYSCPLPPAENWLPIRIEAGERALPSESHA